MEQIKTAFKQYLNAYMNNTWQAIETWFNQETKIEYSTAGTAQGYHEIPRKLLIPDIAFNLLTTTITNCLLKEDGDMVFLWADVHHLHGIEEKNELFPLVYGGKYKFIWNQQQQKICKVEFDLEYEYGDTILVSQCWSLYENIRHRRIVQNTGLYRSGDEKAPIEAVIYKVFWAMDTLDSTLFNEYSTEMIKIKRSGVDGDQYLLMGQGQISAFLEQDKRYFDQNQYSIMIKETCFDENGAAHVTALHLNPGKTGNKHLGANTKYTQFFNEVIEITLLPDNGSWNVSEMELKRKEIPVTYGYEMLEL